MKSRLSRNRTSSKHSIHILIEIDPQEIEVTNGRDGLEIEIGDSLPHGRVGGPALPARDVRVVLPVGTCPTTVSTVSRATVKLAERGATIAPIQPPADAELERESLERQEPKAASRVRPQAKAKKALYEQERKSPRPIARLASWELFGSTPVAVIVISPVTVDAENAVYLHTKLEIAVHYELAPAEPKAAVHLRRPAVVRKYSDPAMVAHSLAQLPDTIMNHDTAPAAGGQPLGGRYLIITDDFTWNHATFEPGRAVPGMIDAFRRLKEWKERRGLLVTLKTVTQIIADGYGDGAMDLQEAIRRYIKYAHVHLGVSWVLLGGAKPIIPVRYVGTVTDLVFRIPTDFYYSSLTVLNETPPAHDWDPGNTGSYAANATGENTDGVNFHADVGLGRVPARTADDANAWVTKLIAYEQFRKPDGSMLRSDWPNQALLVADSWWEWKFPTPDAELPSWSYERRADGIVINAEPPDYDKPDVAWDATTRIWGRIGPDQATAVRINYNRDASASSPGYCFITSDTDDTRSDTATKWILIQGGNDILQATHYCFEHSWYQDRSANDQNLLAAQLENDLAEVQISKLYEDHVTGEEGNETTVDFLGWGPVLPNRLSNPIPHFLSISGHGYPGGLPSTFEADVIQGANNGFHTWITYVYSCHTARFDDWWPSIGELAVIKPEGGAVAYVGASRVVKVSYPGFFREPFFHALANPETRHLGQLADARLLRLPTMDPDDENIGVRSVFMINLLGDPEMPVWVGTPKMMVLSRPGTAVLGQPYNVRLRELTRPPSLTEDAPTIWIADATVTLRQLDSTTARWEVLAKANTDTNGNATLSLERLSPGPVEVTMSKQGFVPFLLTDTAV